MIYMLAIGLCLIVWIILDVLHGGPPWSHPSVRRAVTRAATVLARIGRPSRS